MIWLVACREPIDPTGPGSATDPTTSGTSVDDDDTVPHVFPEVGPTRATYDRDFLPAALELIRAARTEIRAAEYVIYRDDGVDDVLDALEAAAARGVRVRFLADEEGDETPSVVEDLVRSGVDAKLDDPRVTLHNKLVIADGAVLVGSHNLTGSALLRNHEGSTLVADAEVAGWYAAWFDAVWDDAEPELPRWRRTDLVPLADRQVTDAVVACVDGARREVDAVMYAFTWDDRYPGSEVDRIATALEGAHARGVAVRVILDGSPWVVDNGVSDAAIARLRAAGLPTWRTGSFVTTHAKALRCDRTTIVGDANWSYTGLALVHGTSLESSLPALADAHRAFVVDVLSDATPVP